MVKEGQKGDSTYRAQRKAFPLIKEEFRKLIFHSLAYKIATFECEYYKGQFSLKYVF